MYRNYHSNDRSSIIAYVDGACSRNGFHDACAAIGVFWPNGELRDVSCRLVGRQTNQRAEIEAARKAIEMAADAYFDEIIVYTDSKFLYDAVYKWIPNWQRNNWIKQTDGTPVVHRYEFMDLLDQMERIKVKLVKVLAHSGIYGNVEADRLARQALN